MKFKFFLYGLLVYSVISIPTEAVFTGVGDVVRRLLKGMKIDWHLPCRLSLWAVPVYGLSAAVSFALLDTFAIGFYKLPWWVRAPAFSLAFYLWEYSWGFAIEKIADTCFWKYRDSKHRIWRLIKPAYAPLWAAFGFVLEWAHRQLIPLLDTIFPSLL